MQEEKGLRIYEKSQKAFVIFPAAAMKLSLVPNSSVSAASSCGQKTRPANA